MSFDVNLIDFFFRDKIKSELFKLLLKLINVDEAINLSCVYQTKLTSK